MGNFKKCKYIDKCYLGVEYKEKGKHRVIYTLYCFGRKQDMCERIPYYERKQSPPASLLPSGIIKMD